MPPRIPSYAQRMPLVRPPRMAGGGGAAPAFGGSGAPGLPNVTPQSLAALAVQYADDERGRFTERDFVFPPFAAVVPLGAASQSTINVQSNRTSFVRMVALRGGLKNTTTYPLLGTELANLGLRLQVNGEEDFTTSGQQSFPAEFDGLFSITAAPWFWFAAPPRLRVGDTLLATVTNTYPATLPGTETPSPTLTPYLQVRLVDEQWWQAFYGPQSDGTEPGALGP